MSQHINNSLVINAFHISKPIVSLQSDKTFLDTRNIMLKYNIKKIVVVNSRRQDKKQLALLPKRI